MGGGQLTKEEWDEERGIMDGSGEEEEEGRGVYFAAIDAGWSKSNDLEPANAQSLIKYMKKSILG